MYRQIVINVTERFAVLCTFWSLSPEEIIQYYLDHISMTKMVSSIGLDFDPKFDFNNEALCNILGLISNDSFALATFFALKSDSIEPNQNRPLAVPRIGRR